MNLLNKLPVVKKNNFFYLNINKESNKLNNLLNKYIIFELIDDDGVITMPGKLLDIKEDSLIIREHDYENCDIDFSNWIEEVKLSKVRGIEELKNYNESIIDFSKYKNKTVTIINKNNQELPIVLTDYNDYEITFDVKVVIDNKIYINELDYPIYFIKKINII